MLCWFIGLCSPLEARAMSVQPLIVDLKASPRGASGRISVTNTFSRAIPVEVTTHPLAMAPTGEISIGGPPTPDFLIFPPSAVIPPGRTQTFRLQWRGNPDIVTSANYIVSIAQVPVELEQTQSGIQLVYNFQIMANVAPARGAPILAITAAQVRTNPKGEPRASVTIANTGQVHAYLAGTRLKLLLKSPQGRTLWERLYTGAQLNTLVGYGLIRNGQSRTFSIPIDAPAAAMSGVLSSEIVGYDGLR